MRDWKIDETNSSAGKVTGLDEKSSCSDGFFARSCRFSARYFGPSFLSPAFSIAFILSLKILDAPLNQQQQRFCNVAPLFTDITMLLCRAHRPNATISKRPSTVAL